MRVVLKVALGILCLTALASAQTAEELVAKNIQARGGLEKIKAVNTIRMTGKIYLRRLLRRDRGGEKAR